MQAKLPKLMFVRKHAPMITLQFAVSVNFQPRLAIKKLEVKQTHKRAFKSLSR